MTSCK